MTAKHRRGSWGGRGGAAGFTLLELIVVVTIMGIVATLALPQFKNSTRKAKEAILKEDLWVMRDVIDQYKADRGEYPQSLGDLVSAGYLRKVPRDPLTGSADTWITVPYDGATTVASGGSGAVDAATIEDNPDGKSSGGIWDVKSGASGTGLDGSSYAEW